MTGVKCTDKSSKMKKARRARRRLIAGMSLLFLVLCAVLVGILIFQYLFREEHRAAEYELEHYNQAYGTFPFLSADLCVASKDVELTAPLDETTFAAGGLFDLSDTRLSMPAV